MSRQSQSAENPTAASSSGLCRAGRVAAWLLVVYSLATMVQLFVLGGQPATATEAFNLLHENKVIGLLRLDLPTVLAVPLGGPDSSSWRSPDRCT
jgi:hypothetical protein